MKKTQQAWIIDFDLVESIEHVKDILRDADLVFTEYPPNAGYLTDEVMIKLDYEETH